MTHQNEMPSLESSEPTQDSMQARMSEIEHMQEKTIEEVLSKKQAFNDIIPQLSHVLQNVGRPSMDSVDSKPTDLVDTAIEAENDDQNSNIIVSAMKHARNELVRLGDKEEAMIGSTEKAA